MMGKRHIGMRAQAALQVVLADIAEQRIVRIGADAAGCLLQLLPQCDDRNDRIVAGAEEEGDRVALAARRRSDDIMNVGTHETVGRQLEDFAGVDDEGAGHWRRLDPHTVFCLHAQTRYDILQQNGDKAAVLVRADPLIRLRDVTARIADDLQKLGRDRIEDLGKGILRLAKRHGRSP